jgi:hypothetical protein
MRFFVHLVLDEFGAEAAGKVHRELASIASAEGERHTYIWCGAGAPPAEPDFWSVRFPPWDDAVEWPAEVVLQGADWDLDRSAAAASIFGWQGLRDRLRGWIEQRPKELLGAHQPFQAAVILAGSLGEPSSGAILLGLLATFARGRHRGRLLGVPAHAVLGIGLAGRRDATEEEKAYALIARSLMDLAEFFQSRPAHEAAAPIYLVGEAALDGGSPGRAEQVDTAAFTILGLTRSATPLNVPAADVDPFSFDIDEAQRVHWADRPYDPTRPFSVTGGYCVSCSAEPLARLLSARVAALCLELLEQQRGCTSLEDAAKLDIGGPLSAFLDDVERGAASDLWDRVAEKTKIPWPEEKSVHQPQWYDLDRLRLLYGRLFDQKDWQRTLDSCDERLLALPLEDWPGMLDELSALIEQGVLVRRGQQLAIATQRVLGAFLDAVEHGVANVFRRTFQEPVSATPHLAAQALLGRIYRHLVDSRDRLEEIEARARPQLPDPVELRQQAQQARQRFERGLAGAPSPAAVILRMAPLFAGCLGLVLALPFDLGLFNAGGIRFAIGALAGGAVAGYLYMRHMKMIRRRILVLVRAWREQYKAVLEFEDNMARNRAYGDLLIALLECTRWFFNGDGDAPPIPAPVRLPLKGAPANGAPDPDVLRPQTVLGNFRQYLHDAAASYRSAEARFLGDFQVSRRETILPEISVSDPGGIDRELRNIGTSSDRIPPEWMRRLYTRPVGTGAAEWTLPFASGIVPAPAHLWRASFRLPSPEELLQEGIRLGSSGFRFFDTLRSQMRSYFTETFALSTRLSEYVEAFPGQVMASTPLFQRYTSLAMPSAVTSASQVSILVVAANATDPLAAGLNWSNDSGADHLSLHLQVRVFVSAADLIYHPNEVSPTQAMGLAWKTYLNAPWPGRTFLPIVLPKENA